MGFFDYLLQDIGIDFIYRHEPWLLCALALPFLPFPRSRAWQFVVKIFCFVIVVVMALLEMHRHSFWAWSVVLGTVCYCYLRSDWRRWVAFRRPWAHLRAIVLIGTSLILAAFLCLWLGRRMPLAALQLLLPVLGLCGLLCFVGLVLLFALAWLRPAWWCVRLYLRSDPRMVGYLDCARRLAVSDPSSARSSLFPGRRLTAQVDDADRRSLQPGVGFWSCLFWLRNCWSRHPWLCSLVWLAGLALAGMMWGEDVWGFLNRQPQIVFWIYVSLGCLMLLLLFPPLLVLRGFFGQPHLPAAWAFPRRRLGLPALDSRFVMDCLCFQRDQTWNRYEELRYPTTRDENGAQQPEAGCCDRETAEPPSSDKSRKLRKLRLRWLALTEALAECYWFAGPARVTPDGVSADLLEASQVLSEAGELQHEVALDLKKQGASTDEHEERVQREIKLARHFFDLSARCLESYLDPDVARGSPFCEPLSQDTWWKSAAALARQPAADTEPGDRSEHHLRLALFRLYQLLDQLDVRCGRSPSSAADWLTSVDHDVNGFLASNDLPAETKSLLVHFAAYASKTLNEHPTTAEKASPVLSRVLVGNGLSYEDRLAELLDKMEYEELEKNRLETREPENPEEDSRAGLLPRFVRWATRPWASLTRLNPEKQQRAIQRDCHARRERFWRLAGRLREQRLDALRGGVVARDSRIQAAKFYVKARSRRVWRLCSR